MTQVKRVDGVFEGGGVKGIGLVGAAAVVEEQGYTWDNLAGTSAGAIVASLLAAGYTAAELKDIVGSVDYKSFKDCGFITRIPIFGPVCGLIARRGIYAGDFFEKWIGNLLAAKGVKVFGDLVIPGQTDPRYRYKLSVIASDVTNGLMVVLPNGLARYGLDPDKFPVASAVRMSMSIPFFFRPFKIDKSCFVDGGILSNFPVWLFDSQNQPEWPTFGFKLVEPTEGRPNETGSPLSMIKAIVSTMMEAHDKMHVGDEDFVRTIAIPTLGVRTTDFDLKPARRDALYASGRESAATFFKTWDFDEYVRTYRMRNDRDYVREMLRIKKNVSAGRVDENKVTA